MVTNSKQEKLENDLRIDIDNLSNNNLIDVKSMELLIHLIDIVKNNIMATTKRLIIRGARYILILPDHIMNTLITSVILISNMEINKIMVVKIERTVAIVNELVTKDFFVNIEVNINFVKVMIKQITCNVINSNSKIVIIKANHLTELNNVIDMVILDININIILIVKVN